MPAVHMLSSNLCLPVCACSGRDLFTRQAASVEDIGKAGQEARTMVDGLSEFVQVSRPHGAWERRR
jgi:hypothetical protein